MKDLLSVSQFTIDYPYVFEFFSTRFEIRDMRTNQVMVVGCRKGDLYSLEIASTQSFFSLRFRKTYEDIWQRWGHPQSRIVCYPETNDFISVNSQNKSNYICTSCQLGKMCRLPFSQSNNKSNAPFDKIHSDLWDQLLQNPFEIIAIMLYLLMISPVLHSFIH